MVKRIIRKKNDFFFISSICEAYEYIQFALLQNVVPSYVTDQSLVILGSFYGNWLVFWKFDYVAKVIYIKMVNNKSNSTNT